MSYLNLQRQIRTLVAKDQLEEAFQLLIENFSENAQLDHLVLQSGRYIALKNDHQKGIIDYEALQKLLNQLRANILEFVHKNQPNKNTQEKSLSKTIKADYQLAKARIAVLSVLAELNQPETISNIYKLSNTNQRKWVVQVLTELWEIDYMNKKKVGKNVLWSLTPKGSIFAKTIIA